MKSLMAWFRGRSNSKQGPQTSTLTVERLETRDVPSAATFAVASGIVHSQENFNDFVTFEYNHLLRRAPDPNGLNHWVFEMQSGMSPEQVEGDVARVAAVPNDVSGLTQQLEIMPRNVGAADP